MARVRTYHHGSLKETLVDLAGKEVAKNGVEALSLRAIARAAGVAHRAAYQHFPDKDALVAAVLAKAYDELNAKFETAVDASAPACVRLKAAAGAYAAFAFDEKNMFLAMTGPRVNVSGAYKDLEQSLANAWRHIMSPAREAAAAGDFSVSAEEAAAIFWGGLQGVITQALLGRIKLKASERKTFFELTANTLLAGVSSKK